MIKNKIDIIQNENLSFDYSLSCDYSFQWCFLDMPQGQGSTLGLVGCCWSIPEQMTIMYSSGLFTV